MQDTEETNIVDITSSENPITLTDWEKEPTVEDFKQDFKDGSESRNAHINNVNRWLDNLKATGKAKPTKVKGKSNVAPKLIRKQAEWRYASLSEPFLSTDDVFNTQPTTYKDTKAAKQNALVLNYQFNHKLDKVALIDESVRANVDEGTVIFRIGWEFEEEIQEVEEDITQLIPVNDPELAQELISQGINPPVVETVVGTELVEKMVTVKNQPTVDICGYKTLTIDPSCEGNLDKAKFIIFEFDTSLSELRKNPKYINLDKINVNDSSILSESDSDYESFNFKDEPRTLFTAYEYHGYRDIDDSGTLTAIAGTYAQGTMIHLDLSPFPDKKLPFVSVQYLPVRKSIYGEPDGELLEDNQAIVGAVTRGMIDLMGQSANAQVGYRKGSLDVTNRLRFERGADYEFNANVDPANVFYTHKFPEIPQSALAMLGLQNADAESMSGVKAFSSNKGLSGDALGSSVGGIRSALDATTKRELGILRRFAEGFKKIGYKITAMNAEFLDETEVIRITDEEFQNVQRDDLTGSFDITLSISTPEADNEKASDLSFMLQTLGNKVPPEITNMVLSQIAKLRKLPELAKQLEEYKPEPDPIAQETAKLELELLKAKIFNETMKGKENEKDIALKEAKTVSEMSKAKNLKSDSDQKDLDYLEQSSGLSRLHEENMSKLKNIPKVPALPAIN